MGLSARGRKRQQKMEQRAARLGTLAFQEAFSAPIPSPQIAKITLRSVHHDGPASYSYSNGRYWEVKNPVAEERFRAMQNRLNCKPTSLWHGTTGHAIPSITECNLRPGSSGAMFGSGIYLGHFEKASGFARSTMGKDPQFGNTRRYLLKVLVLLGKELEVKGSEHWTKAELWQKGYNSVHGVAGKTASYNKGTLNYDEWIVYDPDQVLVTGIYEYTDPRPVDRYGRRTTNSYPSPSAFRQLCCAVACPVLLTDSTRMTAVKSGFVPLCPKHQEELRRTGSVMRNTGEILTPFMGKSGKELIETAKKACEPAKQVRWSTPRTFRKGRKTKGSSKSP